MTCNKLIKENKNFLINFEKFIKPKLQNPDEGDNYEYINAFCHNLYSQINETIIKLDLKNCTIIESDYLKEQLKEMVKLYFIEIEVDKKYLCWSRTEELAQEHLEYENSFIEPEKFLFEYVKGVIKKLDVELTKNEQQHNIEDETWFKVAVQFINGNIYNNHNKGLKLNITDLAKKFFIPTEEIKISTYRAYVSFTLSDNKEEANRYKNIYYRPDAETELKRVIEYCESKNFEICQEFKEKCIEYNIYI